MDRVAQRYADPFSFLDAYFRAGRFFECVLNIIKAINEDAEHDAEEKQNSMLWDLWVHKYEGKQSFGEWKQAMLSKTAVKPKEKPKVVEAESMTRKLEVAAQTLEKLRRSQQKGGD